MDQSAGTTPSVLAPKAKAQTHLAGSLRVVARALWCVLVLLTLATFVAGLFPYAASLHHLCLSDACSGGDQLTFAGLQGLRAWGLSLDFYVTLVLIRLVVFAGGYLLASLMLFWRKSDDWMILLTSFSLITFAALGFNSPLVGVLSPAWKWSAQGMVFLGNVGFTLFFYLFPNGQFVPRWTRWLVVGAVLEWGVMLFFSSLPSPFATLSSLGLFLLVGSMVLAQVMRYRRVSTQEQRQQTKWVVYGIAVALSGFLVLLGVFVFLLPPLQPFTQLISFTIGDLLLLLIPCSISFAVLRSRLWDIDFIINRTLVYGALTASIVVMYALVVGYFGLAFQVSGSPTVSILATGLVAVLFQPLRSRLQRLVNRLTYGERDDPYAVISRLGKLLETTMAPDAILPTTVETVARALKLPYAAICLQQEGELVAAAFYGTAKDELVHFPLVYQAEQIGELVIAPRGPAEHFTSADRALLEDLARQAGVAAHAVLLSADLKRLTLTLQEAREQLVTAREEERRRLRRDLHDGLGPTLGSLTLHLDGVSDLIAYDPNLARTQVVQIKASVQEAMDDIRRLVYALRPPALDELGLVAALREQAASYQHRSCLAVTVEAHTPLPDLPAAVEVAAYRIVQEALTNVARHAQACTCRVALAAADSLTLSIEDDGRGLPDRLKAGIGLLSMRERRLNWEERVCLKRESKAERVCVPGFHSRKRSKRWSVFASS